MQVKRVYVPYWKWEDWKSGMWSTSKNYDDDLKKAIEFTGNHILYGSAMMQVIFSWPNTMKNSLTNSSVNKKAFVGHCAVCYKIGIGEKVVRDAWKHLTEKQRIYANIEADKAIKTWEIEQKRKLRNTLMNGNLDATQEGFQMKLQLN